MMTFQTMTNVRWGQIIVPLMQHVPTHLEPLPVPVTKDTQVMESHAQVS